MLVPPPAARSECDATVVGAKVKVTTLIKVKVTEVKVKVI